MDTSASVSVSVPTAVPPRRSALLTAAYATLLFLIIVGSKWAQFDRFGSPMPDWDQWDAEGFQLLGPWLDRDNFLSHLFHPHNEHRVVLTKLQNLALVIGGGQWDARVEAAANALLHTALAAAFWVVGRRWLAPFCHAPLFLVTLALFALPLAWQNLLGGFHSQQYWLLGLSFIVLTTLPFSGPRQPRWWLGAFSALLVLGSMGSGFLAAFVAALVVGWRLFRGDTRLRDSWPTMAVAALAIGIGVLARVEVEWHAHMKAKSLHDFVFSIVHSLQWPLRNQDWAAAVLWAPWALVAWHLIRAPRGSDRKIPQAIAALGLWVLAQLAATAYARGAGADYPASRYMDTLGFGTMANALALGWWLSQAAPLRRRLLGGLLAVAWLWTLGAGLQRITRDAWNIELPDAKKYYTKAEGHMRRYLATNDPKFLAYPDIPYPSAETLIDRLAHRGVRGLMPVPLRAPLVLAPAPEAGAGFAANTAIGVNLVDPPRAGLTPAIPPLDYTASYGSFGPAGLAAAARWRSAPVAPQLGGWLRFETAGDLGRPGAKVALELRDAATDRLLAEVRPTKVPGDTWRSAYVRAPAAPFVVVARDDDPAAWLAFSGPMEMSELSYRVMRTVKQGVLIAVLAALGTVALALAVWIRAGGGKPRPDGNAV